MKPFILAITGASGFVGKALLKAVPEHIELRLMVRDRGKLAGLSGLDRAKIIEASFENRDAMHNLCEGADAVIHVAGAIKAVDRQGFFDVNEKPVAALADIARSHGVKRFVLVSSLAAREPAISDYAASKRAGEHGLAYAAREMAWVIMRPPAIYGPGDEATLPLMKALLAKRPILPGSASQRISLMHVDDVAQSLLQAAMGDVATGKVYELDDGKPGGYGWQELLALTASDADQIAKPIFVPRMMLSLAASLVQLWADFSRRAQILSPGKVAELYHEDWVARGPELAGFSPQIGFQQGFQETVAAYRQQGRLPNVALAAKKAPQLD